MKRIQNATVGEARAYFRKLNFVNRRRYWQQVHNPRKPLSPRARLAVWNGINAALAEVYSSKRIGDLIYANNPFLAMLPGGIPDDVPSIVSVRQ